MTSFGFLFLATKLPEVHLFVRLGLTVCFHIGQKFLPKKQEADSNTKKILSSLRNFDRNHVIGLIGARQNFLPVKSNSWLPGKNAPLNYLLIPGFCPFYLLLQRFQFGGFFDSFCFFQFFQGSLIIFLFKIFPGLIRELEK